VPLLVLVAQEELEMKRWWLVSLGGTLLLTLSLLGVPATAALAFSDDFTDGDFAGWTPQGGTWTVDALGRLVGEGDGAPPRDSVIIRDGFTARDMQLQVDMTSLTRVDKAIVFRFRDVGNYLFLNFRAAPFNDLTVAEVLGGVLIPAYADVPIPAHNVGETIQVKASLTGKRFTVYVKGILILDQELPVSEAEGGLGLWVIDDEFGDGLTAFDNVEWTGLSGKLEADCSLDENSPNMNRCHEGTLYVRSWALGDFRILVRFDLSAIEPGSTIQTASLELCLDRISGDKSTRSYAVHRVTKPWKEDEVTCNQASNGVPWDNKCGDYDPWPTDTMAISKRTLTSDPNVFVPWDVTADVQDFLDGVVPNNGWLIRDTVEGAASQYRTDWVSRESDSIACGELSSPRLRVIISDP
jgi:hypothetical protein